MTVNVMQNLHGGVAFVTGGTSGIGLGIAKALATAGANIALTYLFQEDLAKAINELRAVAPNSSVHPIQLDVTDRHAVDLAAREALAVFGKIHLVCNAAGVNVFGPVDEATFDDWDWVLGVNLQGTINVLVTVLPYIKAQGEGGHIVNVGSMASFIGGPSAGVYTTSKFAVRGLSEGLRYSLARHGIGVSLLCPGLTRTSIFEAPLRRPAHFPRASRPYDQVIADRLSQIHAAGMDPMDVGRRTVQAIRENQFYIFTHPEFREELWSDAAEAIAAIPNGRVPAERLAFEEARRRLKNESKDQVQALTQSRYPPSPQRK